MIRTADAAGAGAVVLAGHSVDPYNAKTVRATVGSLFHLPLALEPDPAAAVARLQAAGLVVLAADGAGEVDLDDAADGGLLDRSHRLAVRQRGVGAARRARRAGRPPGPDPHPRPRREPQPLDRRRRLPLRQRPRPPPGRAVRRMTILIDPPNAAGHGRLWSHLASDTSYDELHAFALGLGVPAAGFDRDHYDVPSEWYDRVVAAGATPVTSRELIDRLRRRGPAPAQERGAAAAQAGPPPAATPPA